MKLWLACLQIGYGLQGKDAAYAYGGENTGIVISDKKISEINFDDLLVCESSSDFDIIYNATSKTCSRMW